ncbi:putative glycosyltransferase [Vibrio orientalis CIP 102891 = ATCC 33934]|uniref:Glycosyltransferase n=1 Tax=Vibrio orientalis CIP 102891 = ATCC 33934 TaxID=675816 RepID=C9QDH3_VIBOR|nr:glycosyltransferase [Vibrio orientalis]EEX95075.1 glycosyltransferase [Vibrio orientalis CIP 102891 = ATCC 33934]EGU52136.1 putative glycosyltransferase [Vibrio orientalis CIP 102891 = ATCC 33934]
MNILIYTHATLPVVNYGGTERVIWDLVYALHLQGHQVTLLAGKGTVCDWARVIEYNSEMPLENQIPSDVDVVHFHGDFEPISRPYVMTQHGNSNGPIDPNTIFVSSQHARNHGAQAYVHNGLNWDNYLTPNLNADRQRFHFLGKAAWRVKNVQGAIDITKRAGEQLDILGGHRLNFKMGFRLTLDRHVRFLGMVDDTTKSQVMTKSKGLIFPVTWHEPFGLAITESLYFGCPVFGTPYGSLPELVSRDVGFLSDKQSELIEAVGSSSSFTPVICHEYARDLFNADVMAKAYVAMYEKVVSGEVLNPQLGKIITDFKRLPYIK